MKFFSYLGSSPLGRLSSVLVVCAVTFFAHLGAPEVGLMESRNFVAAREMIAGGSWLIPTMNGALRLAKPPLPTWTVAALQQLTGPTDDPGLLRIPAAVMATLLVLFFWGLLKELTRHQPAERTEPGRTAWLGALVLASSLLAITVGRDGQWDIFSNAWMVGALWLLTRALRTGQLLLYAGAGMLVGLSFLSKGPVALYAMLLPFVGAYATRPAPRPYPVRQLLLGVVVLLMVGGMVGGCWPWYVWKQVQPSVLAVARVEVSSWRERHVQPPWFYFNFPVFTGVWALVGLAALAVPFARRRARAYVPYLFGLIWLLATLVLLSVVPEKKERYMLPLMLPEVLLVVGLLRHWERAATFRTADRWLMRSWAGLLLLVAAGLPIAMLIIKLPGFTPASFRFWVVGIGAVLLGAYVWQAGIRQLQPTSLVLASLGLMLGVVGLLMPAYPAWENRKAEAGIRRMGDIRRTWGAQAMPWYTTKELQIKQVWAAGQPIPRFQPDTTTWPQPALLLITSADSLLPQALGESRRHFRTQLVDSFYTGRDSKSEHLYVHLVHP